MQDTILSVVQTYCRRFQVRPPYFTTPPANDLCLIIAIPSYKEPALRDTLQSLAACRPPSGTVEIIVTLNAPANAAEEVRRINRLTLDQINEWKKSKPEFLNILVICEEALPVNQAGAGLARKIGMDEAVQRWAMAGTDGPVVCLDADCTVSENYLREAERAFADPSVRVGHFRFNHLYQQEPDLHLREGIIRYELHLRCYVQGLRLAGYPFAIHTVGSCMAVRASAYARAGGMNKRKAGEDFYFLHKLVPLGGWKEITAGTVFPSCRASDRVPFGTGRAQLQWQQQVSPAQTYHPGIFEAMKPVFESVGQGYHKAIDTRSFIPPVREFLDKEALSLKLDAMRKQASTPGAFAKRFWQWMDGFNVLKLTHYLRDHGFEDQPMSDVAAILLSQCGQPPEDEIEKQLMQFRAMD